MTSTGILSDASDAELGAAVEENLWALFRAMATLSDGELVEGEHVSYHLAPATNPMFKGVWRTRLQPEDADEAIDATIAWFKARGAPFLFWWTGPSTTPRDLGARLVARGLTSFEEPMEQFAPGIAVTESGAPGMVADLHRMHEQVLADVPPGFTIEEVRAEADLYDFQRVLIEGYDMPDWAAQGWVDATLSAGIGKTPWTLYLGRLNGDAVATNILFNGGGVASVYGVATVPGARRKGLGSAITLKPLLDARAAGYRYAVLFASEMGIRPYERIGFRSCGVRINRYLWRNEA